MAKLRNAKVKSSSGGYARAFDNDAFGHLLSMAQSTVISNGSELERIILRRANNISDLDKFINDFKANDRNDGTYICPKKALKNSQYALDGNEPDFLVITTGRENICRVIELKDGDSFDTKKSAIERQNLDKFTKEFGRQTPFITEYYICCFNQLDKRAIITGFKNVFSPKNVMTGKELCDILGISYEDILEERKGDAKENLEYFIEKLCEITTIKEMIDSYKNKN